MQVIPVNLQDEIIALFEKHHKTVRQIASCTHVDEETILRFLTEKGHWSIHCNSCILKRCYDCRGLQELGKPISIQDRINFMADNNNA